MTRARAAVAVSALLLTLTGCTDDAEPTPAAATSGPSVRTVSGTLTLDDPDGFTWSSSAGCAGTRGYDDITAGAQVVITDPAGATIALGKLDEGKLDAGAGAVAPRACMFRFLIADVPTGHGFYGVEVSRRGKVQYPEQQLFGVLNLTIG